jgi:hypothetical protein
MTTVLGAGMMLCGCATNRNGMALDCVGPQPAPVTDAKADSGTLVVFSAQLAGADFDTRDAYRPEYSNYKIYNANGELQQLVVNNSGNIFQEPASVKLAVGQYRVFARANGYGNVTVPVMIKPGQTTVLHLEGGSTWQRQAGFNPTNTVHLPGGEIVGWKAATS